MPEKSKKQKLAEILAEKGIGMSFQYGGKAPDEVVEREFTDLKPHSRVEKLYDLYLYGDADAQSNPCLGTLYPRIPRSPFGKDYRFVRFAAGFSEDRYSQCDGFAAWESHCRNVSGSFSGSLWPSALLLFEDVYGRCRGYGHRRKPVETGRPTGRLLSGVFA